jgi:menaquinone-dependent protoporphyrinogen oxidase
MTRVLGAYASKNGATAEIAAAIGHELGQHGVEVDCLSADAVGRVDDYDAVVLGSAVYMKRWQRDARRLLHHQRAALADKPFWLFSSGPVGDAPPDPDWCEPKDVVREAEHLGVRDHVIFGGRVPADPHNFVERAMAKNTPPEHRDKRDWEAIRDWAAAIAADLEPARMAAR